MSTSTIEFKIGQEVMVPMRGLCELKALKSESILGQELKMAVLKPQRGETLLKIPVDQLEEQGVRELASEEELKEAKKQAENALDLNEQNFVERLDRWTDLIRDGDYGSRILVLREIELVRRQGNLKKEEESFRKKVRLAARRELENVLQTSASSAGRRLNSMISGF